VFKRFHATLYDYGLLLYEEPLNFGVDPIQNVRLAAILCFSTTWIWRRHL